MLVRRCVVVGLAVLAGCDDHVFGEPLESTEAPSAVYTCDWQGVQEFFGAHCDACHRSDGEGNVGSGGFDLYVEIEAELGDGDPANDYYVVPGDPAASVLWQSISGAGPALIMPYGYTEPLENAKIEHVECWILDGAPL